MIAPSFPEAAAIPWTVERYRVGKDSAGTINVVVFGPKFRNTLRMQYKAASALLGGVFEYKMAIDPKCRQ